MKRKTRKILMVLAMATISAFGVLFASCGAGDWLNEKVDQLTCKHEYDDGIELESATCSEYGKVLKTCTICYYEKTEKIDKLPHTETVVAAEAPTCTKDGKTDGVVCSVCDEIIVRQKSVPKLGHDITILEAVEPTCLTSGKTEGKYCNRCNETVVEQKTISALGHKVTTTYGKAATCTESGLTNGQACARCATVYVAQEVIPATGHTYGDHKMVKLPTCLESGLSEQTCTICGSVKKHSIRPTGHSFEDNECTSCGDIDVAAVAAMKDLQVESVATDSILDNSSVYRVALKDFISEGVSPRIFEFTVNFNEALFEERLGQTCNFFGNAFVAYFELSFNSLTPPVFVNSQILDLCLGYNVDGSEEEFCSEYLDYSLFSGYAFSSDYEYFYFVPDFELDAEVEGFFTFTFNFDCEKVIL